MARRKQSGLGLVGILLIVAVFYFTGAGSWVWARIERFGGDCYAMANGTVPQASMICDGSSKIIDWVGQLSGQLHTGMDALRQRFGASGNFPNMSGLKSGLSEGLSKLGSSGSALKQRLQQGPQQLWNGNVDSQLQPAIDHYRIGVNYLQQGSSSNAVSWLQSGASAPGGYGIMSQLQLGDLYNRGASGIAPDSGKARYYYDQAKTSLQQLKNSSAPQAQQLLQSLPVSVSELEAKLK